MRKPISDSQLEKMIEEMSYKGRSLPDSFESDLHEKLLKFSKTSRLFSVPAAAFAFLVVFAAGFLFGNFFKKNLTDIENNSSHSVIADAEVITGETVTVKLVYDADSVINNVNFRIALPEGLAFHSQNTEISSTKIIEWSGSLHKGRNEIPFVVKATSSGKWLINASADYRNGSLTHEITVMANPGDSENKEALNV